MMNTHAKFKKLNKIFVSWFNDFFLECIKQKIYELKRITDITIKIQIKIYTDNLHKEIMWMCVIIEEFKVIIRSCKFSLLNNT